MIFQLPKLPYSKTAFEPFLSEESFNYHYEKHHLAYIEKMNELISEKHEEAATLEELVLKSEGALFNNAGQAWNHTFFWHCMKPGDAAMPSSVSKAIEKSFGDVEGFKDKFVAEGKKQFGSGWTWLVKDDSGNLSIVTTPNAENPIRQGKIPVLVADVWEHAYYIDHRNDRGTFLKTFLHNVNWDFVAKNLESTELPNMGQFMRADDQRNTLEKGLNVETPKNAAYRRDENIPGKQQA